MAAHATKTADELWNYQNQEPHRFGGVEQSVESKFIFPPCLYLSPLLPPAPPPPPNQEVCNKLTDLPSFPPTPPK